LILTNAIYVGTIGCLWGWKKESLANIVELISKPREHGLPVRFSRQNLIRRLVLKCALVFPQGKERNMSRYLIFFIACILPIDASDLRAHDDLRTIFQNAFSGADVRSLLVYPVFVELGLNEAEMAELSALSQFLSDETENLIRGKYSEFDTPQKIGDRLVELNRSTLNQYYERLEPNQQAILNRFVVESYLKRSSQNDSLANSSLLKTSNILLNNELIRVLSITEEQEQQ
jgi:hypothetical protein